MRTEFLLPAVVLSFVFSGLKAQVDAGDSLALVDLYNSTNGSKWLNHTNWLTAKPVSNWYGITVSDGSVTAIQLLQNHLTGHLPASFTNLTHLTELNLSQNDDVNIKLTAAIGNFTALEELNLYRTATTGSLPEEIGKLTKLVYLNVGICKLTGSLPVAIGKLSLLIGLDLSYNALSGGIPISLGGLSNLVMLNLSNNQFSGKLPTRGSFSHLESLSLSDNQLTGPLPGWIVKSKSLTSVGVANNQFSGPLPEELKDSKLNSIYASYNHFSGPIPEWLLTKRLLFDLFLDHNDFYRPDNFCTRLSGTVVDMDLSSNRYTFNGLECITEDRIYYVIAPQAQIKIHSYNNGLAVSAGGTLSNNTYNWYKTGLADSVVIKGDSTFMPPTSGSYYAKVTNKAVSTLTLRTDTFTYTKPARTQNINVFVYPNPVKGVLTINGLNEMMSLKITIADMSGYVWATAISRQQSAMKLDVSRLKSGNYLVNMNDGKVVKTVMFMKE